MARPLAIDDRSRLDRVDRGGCDRLHRRPGQRRHGLPKQQSTEKEQGDNGIHKHAGTVVH
ncbi:MAG: hypothetical protein R2873_21285 [Caldilineaceae bacterium]